MDQRRNPNVPQQHESEKQQEEASCEYTDANGDTPCSWIALNSSGFLQGQQQRGDAGGAQQGPPASASRQLRSAGGGRVAAQEGRGERTHEDDVQGLGGGAGGGADEEGD